MTRLEQRLAGLVRDAVADPSGPGAVVGVATDNGATAIVRGGLANLEHLVPIEADTVFHVASLSKQFTAYATQLLIEAGALALDDAAAAYLDWLPRDDITVEHLFRHISGLRDQWQLVEASGRRMEDAITTDDIVALVRRQRGLNFAPGTRFSYSNTNYTALGLIVEKCAGMSLHEFCSDAIFEPLGMSRTRFVADHHEVVPHRADSYEPADRRGYRRLALSYSTVGATGLNSTVPDMLRWLADAATREGRRRRELITPLPEPGAESYGAGVRLGSYGGDSLVYHAGADAGYRCHFMALPDRDTAAVVLSNLATLPADALCRHALELVAPPPLSDGGRFAGGKSNHHPAIAGSYLDRDGDLIRLRLRRSALEVLSNGRVTVLEADGPVRFGFYREGEPVIELTADGAVLYTDEPASAPQPLTPMDCSGAAAPDPDHRQLVGAYVSDELDAQLRIVEKEGELWLQESRGTPLRLHQIRATSYVVVLPSASETRTVRLDFDEGGGSLNYSTPLARWIHFRRTADGRC